MTAASDGTRYRRAGRSAIKRSHYGSIVSHTTTITVRFADLDPYDHVNHARYLTYFESARVEMLDSVGFGMLRMKREGFQIVLVEVSVRFHAAASLHDELAISTDLLESGRASTRWRQVARVDGRLIAELEARAAFTDAAGRPIRPPEGFAAAVARAVRNG
jgi:YbgC/YbaW family acyl-CoA thioester hydrolase